MAQLDKYLQHLLRAEARMLVLQSNGPVVARLPSGVEKTSSQVVDHAVLVAAVQEASPAEALAALRAQRPTRFRYPPGDPRVLIEVTPTPGAWRVQMTPLPTAATPTGEGAPRSAPQKARAHPSQGAATATPQTQPAGGSAPPPAAPPPAAPAQHADTPTLGALADSHVPEGDLDTSRIDALLRAMARLGASDLHLGVGRPPIVRLHGSIKPMDDEAHAVFTKASLMAVLFATMPHSNRAEFVRQHDTDYAYELPGVARFRCNAYVDRKGPAAAMRRIPEEVVTPEQLGLSKAMLELCNLSKGLVLVTGPTGSGKSTTLAALIDRINGTRRDHIITIEDPIEFVHRNKRCLINQREVRVHTESFRDALRAALREDPDVVLVGELRDLETMAMAIETAETGHLVFGTLHTRTAASTVDRIIDPFPAERQGQIRTMLSESLKGVIAQTLCKKIGGGRVAAYEVLLGTPAVSNLIREGKTFQIPSVMQTNRGLGMITLHDALCELVKAGKVDPREALAKAVSRAELRKMLTEAGVRVAETPGLRE